MLLRTRVPQPEEAGHESAGLKLGNHRENQNPFPFGTLPVIFCIFEPRRAQILERSCCERTGKQGIPPLALLVREHSIIHGGTDETANPIDCGLDVMLLLASALIRIGLSPSHDVSTTCRYPSIAENHGFVWHQTYARWKPLKINGLVLSRKS